MNERILIIEDDQDIAFIEKDYLEMSGYTVVIASDGLAGLNEALSGRTSWYFSMSCCPAWTGLKSAAACGTRWISLL